LSLWSFYLFGWATLRVHTMANHRKTRGYRTQKVIADYLKQFWAYADTAGAGRQGEDILNIPTLSIEVKARSDFQPLAWIKQAESNANGKLPMVIMRCNGQGEDAGEYLAFVKVKHPATYPPQRVAVSP